MSPKNSALLLAFLFLAACSQNEQNGPAGAPAQLVSASTAEAQASAQAQAAVVAQAEAEYQVASASLDVALQEGSSFSSQDLLVLASFGPVTNAEHAAVTNAKERMAQVKGATAIAEQDKEIAAGAKSAYEAKLASYQKAIAEANNAKAARVKAMASLTAAQKELDDAWTSVAAARDAYNKVISNAESTDAQKNAAEATLKKAHERADQANAALPSKTTDVQTAQMAYSSTLNSVTVAADAASMAGADYARKTATATKSVEALTAALAEEKKAHAVIASLNRARAKEMATNLEDAAFAIITTGKAADSARWAAKQAEDADKAASARAANAAKEDQAAKQAVITTDAILAEATVMARSKAMAKENADKAASAALEAYNAAKGPFEGPLAAVTQSTNAAAALEKPMKDARWRVVLATREVTAAEAAIAKSKSSQNQKNLDAAKAKLASMNAAHEVAKGKYDAAMAEAAAAEAAAAEAKKELEVFAAPHRQAAAAAAEAAKEKAAADSALATAQKNAASAKSVAAAKASALVKANSDADASGAAAEAAGQRRATAVKAESDARSTYTELYSKQETYKISVLRTEQQEQSNEEKLYKAALWANVKDADYWTSLVVAAIRHELPRLEKAKDINDWCPAYWSASDHHKEVCWLRILGGLVKTESSFKPETKFYEADMKKYSVGMMALSPPNECRNYDTVELLQNPLLNLACGIGKFAGLIERDGVIYGKTIVTNPRTKKKEEKFLGPSAYWSTMRPPYKRQRFDGSCCFNLGKMNEITAFTKQYRNY